MLAKIHLPCNSDNRISDEDEKFGKKILNGLLDVCEMAWDWKAWRTNEFHCRIPYRSLGMRVLKIVELLGLTACSKSRIKAYRSRPSNKYGQDDALRAAMPMPFS